jgi:trans-aconitate methyltransferase
MKQDWKNIWNKRETSFILSKNTDILSQMLMADGYDGGGGISCISTNYYKSYVSHIEKRLSATVTDSLFEVGCGCGPILYVLKEKGHKIGGIDFSDILIKKAKEVLTDADIKVMEASMLEVKPSYDFVISNGVFNYFPSFEYAVAVLNKMYEKSRKGIAILEIPDARLEVELEAERRKAVPDYDEKFKGIKHRYYAKSLFLSFAEQKQCSAIVIENHYIENYGYNGHRFNCFMFK